MAEPEQWYWSLKQHRVVAEGEEKAENRLGPYRTREEAEQALKRVGDRNESWDNDPTWNDQDEDEQERVHLDGSPVED